MPQPLAPALAPPARPPRYGLIPALTPTPIDVQALLGGWHFEPELCGEGGAGAVSCYGTTDAMDPTASGGPLEWAGIWLWAADECSSFGYEARDWQGRARRQLTAVESFLLAREMWAGAVAQAEGLPNKYLTDPTSDTVTSAAADPVDALGAIEGGLAELLAGQQGMVHVTPQVLTHLRAAGAITRDGNVWTTAMGHVVIADAGYTGAGPGGGAPGSTQWMYGTPWVQIALAPVELIPGTLEDAVSLARAMDRAVNTITVVAGRVAGYQWANDCGHVAAQVDVAVPLVGGAS